MPVTQQIEKSTISRDALLGYGERPGTLAAVVRSLNVLVQEQGGQGPAERAARDASATVLAQLEAEIAALVGQLCDAARAAAPAAFSAYNCQANMSVAPAADTTILWDTVTLTHPSLPYDSTSGQWTPQRKGYYLVYAYFNDLYGNSSTQQSLRVSASAWCSITSLDDYTGTTADRLAGEAIVYCNGSTDTFEIKMANLGGTTNSYRVPLSGDHNSYVNVKYLGNELTGLR